MYLDRRPMKQIEDVELGRRLRIVRKTIGMTQLEVADIIKVNHHSVSRLEKFGTGNIIVYNKMLQLYAKYVYLNTLFQDDFQIVLLDEGKEVKDNINEAVIDNIYNAVQEFDASLTDAKTTLQKNIASIISLLD